MVKASVLGWQRANEATAAAELILREKPAALPPKAATSMEIAMRGYRTEHLDGGGGGSTGSRAKGLRWCSSAPQLGPAGDGADEAVSRVSTVPPPSVVPGSCLSAAIPASRLSATAPLGGSQLSAVAPQGSQVSSCAPEASMMPGSSGDLGISASSAYAQDMLGGGRNFVASAPFSPPRGMRGGPVPLRLQVKQAKLREEALATETSPCFSGGRRHDVAPWLHLAHPFQDHRGTRSHLMPSFSAHNHVSRPCAYTRDSGGVVR